VIIPVDPTLREANRSQDMKLIEFFMTVHPITPRINHYYVLVRKIQKLFQILIRRTH